MKSPETIEAIAKIAVDSNFEPAGLLAICHVENGGKAFVRVDGRQEPLSVLKDTISTVGCQRTWQRRGGKRSAIGVQGTIRFRSPTQALGPWLPRKGRWRFRFGHKEGGERLPVRSRPAGQRRRG